MGSTENNMKKTAFRILAVTVVVILISASLASCANKLSGTYTSTEDSTTYKFSLFSDKMIYSIGGVVELECTYEIDQDKIYLTILGDRIEKTYSKQGSSIFIDGIEFVKE